MAGNFQLFSSLSFISNTLTTRQLGKFRVFLDVGGEEDLSVPGLSVYQSINFAASLFSNASITTSNKADVVPNLVFALTRL